MGGGSLSDLSDNRDRIGAGISRTSLSALGMVLVSGHNGSDDWPGSSRQSSHGRPLRLSAVHWFVRNGCLGNR